MGRVGREESRRYVKGKAGAVYHEPKSQGGREDELKTTVNSRL